MPIEKARDIRLLVLDVDGVLTDGGLYYDADGRIMKRFHVQDGLGIKLAQRMDLEIGVITGLDHPAVASRVRELGISEYHAGHVEKRSLIVDMAARKSLELAQIAYLGDDWVDATAMRAVGLPMAVANAQPEILALAAWVSSRSGGHGAAREAIAFILEAQGKYSECWRAWSD